MKKVKYTRARALDYIPFAKRSWEDDSDPRNCFHTKCCHDYTGPSRLHGECIKRQRKPISISVYKHCFLEEPRAMNPAVACLEDIKAACISSTSHPPPLLLSLPCRPPPPSSRCRGRWQTLVACRRAVNAALLD